MTTQTEALKLALEALEFYDQQGIGRIPGDKAITAIRSALAEQPAGPQGLRPSNAEIIEIRKSVKGSGLELWSDTLAFAHALLNAAHGIKE